MAKRAARRSEQALAAEQMLELIDNATDSREDVETIVAALARLDREDRELVQLKIYAGLTFREIAEVTGRPQATVATRYRRALDSLRPWLVKQYQE